jgi:hypothetical protein
MRTISGTPRPVTKPRFARLFPAAVLLSPLLAMLALSASSGATTRPPSAEPCMEPVRLSVGVGRLHPWRDEVGDIYGGMIATGARLAIPIKPGLDGIAGAAWVHGHGNPYYDAWAFEGDDAAEFTAVPLEFGLLVHEPVPRGHRVNFGFVFQEIWARERIPQGSDADAESASGWGWGGRVFLGPEWFLAGRRYSLGFELSLAARSVCVGEGYNERKLALSGTDWRFFVARRLF